MKIHTFLSNGIFRRSSFFMGVGGLVGFEGLAIIFFVWAMIPSAAGIIFSLGYYFGDCGEYV